MTDRQSRIPIPIPLRRPSQTCVPILVSGLSFRFPTPLFHPHHSLSVHLPKNRGSETTLPSPDSRHQID